jgi:ABC-type uncharacterized transport system permease subunit
VDRACRRYRPRDSNRRTKPICRGAGPKTNELEGYTYIYYALVFVPGGVLLGLAARQLITLGVGETPVLALAIVVPSILLEMLLVRISGRAFSLFNVSLSALFAIAGIIWINLDRQRPQAATMATDQK